MPYIVRILLLAIVQGVTEFLPVSSSGHLVLFQHFLKVDSPGIVVEVALHFGTLISILIYFRGRIADLLVQVIDRYLEKGELDQLEIEHSSQGCDYYIIHPLLKHIVLGRLP